MVPVANCEDGVGDGFLDLGKPDDVDVSVEFKDWLFALEGAQEIAERWWFDGEDVSREERCWHTTFQSLKLGARSKPKHLMNGAGESFKTPKYPVELVTVSISFVYSMSKRHCLKMCLSAFSTLHIEAAQVLISLDVLYFHWFHVFKSFPRRRKSTRTICIGY